MGADVGLVVRWWATLFLVGAAAFPLTKRLFAGWHDSGYFLAKAVGMALATYLVYLAGTLRVLPFSLGSILLSLVILFGAGAAFQVISDKRHVINKIRNFSRLGSHVSLLFFEELFFFAALLFWSWIKGHEPSIRGLEKFMDFGFAKSILTHPYFPTPDMWYAGGTINYYYFGHIVLAMLTKLSGIDLGYTFNLMLASLFALCLTMSFSIGYQLGFGSWVLGLGQKQSPVHQKLRALATGLLTAFLVTLAGNLQTVYAFTRGYIGEDVKPFWKILWGAGEFLRRLPEGLERYWYPNATRFIPFTIHEFPSYSFVVSDVHGHVLGIPFALLAIALLVRLFGIRNQESGIRNISRWAGYGFYGFLVAVLLMTNASDGPIYFGLFAIIFMIHDSEFLIREVSWWKQKATVFLGVFMTAAVASLPFLFHFKSFVTGVALNCPPAFLADSKIGPILFEGVEKCQRSPLWMMLVLWGFFLYCGGWLIASVCRRLSQTGERRGPWLWRVAMHERLLLVFFFFSVALLIFPEFFYFKDIYPAHFRSNTMFKLGYQAFMMFSIVSAYTIVNTLMRRDTGHVIRQSTPYVMRHVSQKLFFLFLLPLLFLVSIYPIFAVRSYFDSLRTYKGLYGLTWLQREYPDDFAAIEWLNKAIRDTKYATRGKECNTMSSVACHVASSSLVEADGDSYTDYNRFSAFTGMPTVVGWAVHEWLWRGGYEIVSPRREEVRTIYESSNADETRRTLSRYSVHYVVVGTLERQHYTELQEWKFTRLGTAVFRSGSTVIYAVNPSSASYQ